MTLEEFKALYANHDKEQLISALFEATEELEAYYRFQGKIADLLTFTKEQEFWISKGTTEEILQMDYDKLKETIKNPIVFKTNYGITAYHKHEALINAGFNADIITATENDKRIFHIRITEE